MSNLDASKLISIVREYSFNLYKESNYMDAVAHYEKECNDDFIIYEPCDEYWCMDQTTLNTLSCRLMYKKLENPVYLLKVDKNHELNKNELSISVQAIMEKTVYNHLIS